MDCQLAFYESRIIAVVGEVQRTLPHESDREFKRLLVDVENYRAMFARHIERVYSEK